MAESKTENLFRGFHGTDTFVEKRDIPKDFGFQSKRAGSTDAPGHPDFFKEKIDVAVAADTETD